MPVINGTFTTVYTPPDPSDAEDGLIYVENSNEFWRYFDDGVNPRTVRRMDGDTFAVVGTITLGPRATHFLPSWSMYDGVNDKVWGVAATKLIRFDTVANTQDLNLTHLVDLEGDNGFSLTLDRSNGTPWITTATNGAGDAFLYKLNSTDGTLTSSYTIGTAFNLGGQSPVVDNNGDCWFVKFDSTAILYRADEVPGTVTTEYSDAGAFRIFRLAYDATRHCIWMAIPIEDPAVGPIGDKTWRFKRYNIALDAVDVDVGPFPALYLTFEFDNVRDILWAEEFYAFEIWHGYSGVDGSLAHEQTETEAISGMGRYSFVMGKSGNNVFMYNQSTATGALTTKYSWPEASFAGVGVPLLGAAMPGDGLTRAAPLSF